MEPALSLPQLEFDPSTLPVGQLESLRFKINQIIESIQNLQRTIEFGVQANNGFIPNALPPWPDLLAKYNLLVSQTHTLSNSLSASFSQQNQGNPAVVLPGTRPKAAPSNPYEKLALHPSSNIPEAQFDNELIPLLRSQQTVSVLNSESALVARIQEAIKEINAMNGISRLAQGQQADHERTIQACETMRNAHDARVDRARRAVTLLRDKYDWKARVEITFPVTPPPETQEADDDMEAIARDNEEVESAYLGNMSSEAGDAEDDDEEEEEEEEMDDTGASPNDNDVVDLTGSPTGTPGVMAVDTPNNAGNTPGMVIDITNSAPPTPAGEDSESDVALAGIFTPADEEAQLFPPAA
jgi:hypothetical protein